MHASVRRYRVRDIDALVSKVEDEFVEQVKEIDGELYNVEFAKYEKIRDPFAK